MLSAIYEIDIKSSFMDLHKVNLWVTAENHAAQQLRVSVPHIKLLKIQFNSS